ncbi:uncharacterized protein LOC143153292 [Ptiloglossa arizonensis]|uniref:uncharacterized protein LOC143153292 n=1 Tax=Ptiloglossa arizonensis TaxID=3350558 RepID=UPI003F9FCF27
MKMKSLTWFLMAFWLSVSVNCYRFPAMVPIIASKSLSDKHVVLGITNPPVANNGHSVIAESPKPMFSKDDPNAYILARPLPRPEIITAPLLKCPPMQKLDFSGKCRKIEPL